MQSNSVETVKKTSMKPNRKTPRDLPVTAYGMHENIDGDLVYDSPEELNQYLIREQGMAVREFRGTCGLCSCANLLIMAGVKVTEGDMIAYAANTESEYGFREYLCTTGDVNPANNGGTSCRDRIEILNHFGLEAGNRKMAVDNNGKVTKESIEALAQYVESGRGVILPVRASSLWGTSLEDDLHAVTVTSVKKSTDGKVLGFYICDTGDSGTQYYDVEDICDAIVPGLPYNYTYAIIR